VCASPKQLISFGSGSGKSPGGQDRNRSRSVIKSVRKSRWLCGLRRGEGDAAVTQQIHHSQQQQQQAESKMLGSVLPDAEVVPVPALGQQQTTPRLSRLDHNYPPGECRRSSSTEFRIITKDINYIAQVRKGHKCTITAEMAVWLRNCVFLYSYLHN